MDEAPGVRGRVNPYPERRSDMYIGIGALVIIIILVVVFLL